MSKKSLVEYVSLKRTADGRVTLDIEPLEHLRDEFQDQLGSGDINNDKQRNEAIRKAMDKLQIENDAESVEYFKIAVKERSIRDTELEIIDKYRGAPANLSPVMDPFSTSQTTSSAKAELVSEVICLINRKSNRSEVTDFIRDFLFDKVPPMEPKPKSDLILDDKVHPLPSETMLDLFIRQQMFEREVNTFSNPTGQFRIVRPISLSDEFDSWTFDHLRGLIDFWLVLDPTGQKLFPSLWRLDPQAKINYIIVNRTFRDFDRPSTKSLDGFIRDICLIDGYGSHSTWYKALVENEHIQSCDHLTNLNRKEWDNIRALPPHAIKRIKFYVDREKQLIEEPKTKTDETSLSTAEIRANLHMIKLYFVRHVEKAKAIPRLDQFCVRKAFEEMRADGYEEDGLFKEMELFFQPLTITDKELEISPQVLEKSRAGSETAKKKYQEQIDNLTGPLAQEKETLEQYKKDSEILTEQLENLFDQYKKDLKKPENSHFTRKRIIQSDWAAADTPIRTNIQEKKQQIAFQIAKINGIESQIKGNEDLLKNIEKLLDTTKTQIDRRLVKPNRGFIMYGPPGTGKSAIMEQLAKKIGIATVGPPLAAGELERSLVGQSEAIILDLCMRANRLPHLMCCVSIDEVDSLAPRRNDNSSEGKVSKISVLLSLIEGIKDVPNLMIFSATNRLHMMDEAFLRRMTGKFFVGRPSAEARKRILDSVPKHILTAPTREKLAIATTNFSGAALKVLIGTIAVHYVAEQRKRTTESEDELSEEETLQLADQVAQHYQYHLGIDTLPQLMLNTLAAQRRAAEEARTSNEAVPIGFHLPKDNQYTGKILIDLRQKSVRIEAMEKGQRYIIEDKLRAHEQNVQQLLERITSYGNDRNVQLLQMIDLNLLSSKGAYEEKKIFEILKESYDECIKNKRSMIIYDLDSVIGVNQTESESSAGTSTDSSVVNQHLYIHITSRFREAKIETVQGNNAQPIERWAVAVARDEFLLRKFTADVDFSLTVKQQQESEKNQRRANEIIMCVKCRDYYVEKENKIGVCAHHDGFVFDNSSPALDALTPSAAINRLNEEEFLANSNRMSREDMDKGKSRFKYICCNATLKVGTGSSGCKRSRHGWKDDNVNEENRSGLSQKTIDEWEAACLDNSDYNQRLGNLLNERERLVNSFT